jgi:NDP-mannose synthase
MGVYCLNKKVLDRFPSGQPYGFDELVINMLVTKHPITVKQHSGYWLDIGRPDDYQKATDEWPVISRAMNL